MEKSYLILVAGGTGSGKTTVADKLLKKFDSETIHLISIDDYYLKQDLSYEERCKTNYDNPSSVDFDLAVNNIKDLLDNKIIEKPLYDFTIHQRKEETEIVHPTKIILVEGIFALIDERLRDLATLKIYVDTDSDIRFIRRLKRDMSKRNRSLESVITQYLTTVKPMHDAFIEKTKKYADIIIPNDNNSDIAVEVIENKLFNLIK